MPHINQRKPNVVFVLTDDQGYADLGCTGNPWIKTPNIDDFASRATRFSDFHVQPLCTPTRGAIMTGRRPVRNGAWATCWGRSILKREEVTMADVFAASGYHTGMFGKWHLGDNYPYRPFDRGFNHTVAHKGGGVGQVPDFWGNNYFDDTYFFNGQARSTDGYCTDVWFEQAMEFIDGLADEEPFFAYIATNAPHSPYLVADKYADQYRRNPDIVEPEFYGMITNIDENFGRLEQYLKRKGLLDNTILIFMTDNGSSGGANLDKDGFVEEGYNSGMRGKKGSYYDGGHRVPFFVRWPAGGLAEGRDIEEMSLDIDLLPTFIDLCDLERPPGPEFDGMSLAPLISGEHDVLPERVNFLNILQSSNPPKKENGAVMTRQWRLVHGTELYDIKADPGQLHDIAARYPEIVNSLKQELNNWWNEVSPGFDDVCCISLGNDAENPTKLDAMDVMGDVAWQQAHIISAQKTTGVWNVDVERPGNYRFSLRRWPAELPLPIDGMVSCECAETIVYPGAERVPMSPPQARLAIFAQNQVESVEAGHESVVFEIGIRQTGKTQLEAWFIDDQGNEQGAYYVLAELL